MPLAKHITRRSDRIDLCDRGVQRHIRLHQQPRRTVIAKPLAHGPRKLDQTEIGVFGTGKDVDGGHELAHG